MADKYYFCASAGKNVVIAKNVIKTGGTVSMGILGKIATSACSNNSIVRTVRNVIKLEARVNSIQSCV